MSDEADMRWSDVYERLWQRMAERAPEVDRSGRARDYSNARSYAGAPVPGLAKVYLHVGFRQQVLGTHHGVHRVSFVEFYTDHPGEPAWQALMRRVGADGGPVAGVLPEPEAGQAARILAVREPPLRIDEALAQMDDVVDWLRATWAEFATYSR